MPLHVLHTRNLFERFDQLVRIHFGSKKGFFRSTLYGWLNTFGYFSQYKKVQFNGVKRLIFICQGNICRSPLAEAVANNLGIPTQSYGLGCSDNHPADPRAKEFAQHLNITLEHHRTRHISHYTPQNGDLLVGMEPVHARQLLNLFGSAIPITLAGLWLPQITPYIHDPFNTCQEFFCICEKLVVESVEAIVHNIQYSNVNSSYS